MADPITAAGLAAAVLQLADIGANLAIKLFTIGKQVKNAAGTYEAISKEVSLTSTVLQQLGKNLEGGNGDQVHNDASLKIVNSLIKECETIFAHLRAVIGTRKKQYGSSGAKSWSEWCHRLALPYKEKNIETSRARLENLKSLLSIILASLTLAAQVKSSQSRYV